MKKTYANSKHKKDGEALLISGKTDSNTRELSRDRKNLRYNNHKCIYTD